MRLLLVGLILVALHSAAMAQVSGFVEAIGFNNAYRPDSWTPVLINLTSQSNATGDYQIQIVQQDLDRDNVTFTRDITLNAGTQQKFWAYFIPQPTNHGLPDSSMDDLQKVLRVYLATRPDGGGHTKQLAQLPVRLTLNNLDPADPMANNRGQRLLLWITDGSSRPAGLNSEQLSERVVGTKEELSQVGLKPRELPENVLAYDAVDTILWLNADAQELDEAGARRKEAIEQFVQRGGQLVICQPAEIHRLDALADLLPVELSDAAMVNCKTLDPLPKLARPSDAHVSDDQFWLQMAGQHQFQFAHARARGDAIVSEWIDWQGDGSDRTPFIARRAWGLGSVTWVAADLGDPQLSLNIPRWPIIWDRVFGWNNATIINPSDADAAMYAPGGGDPVSASDFLFKGTDQEGKGAGLIGIAILFFVLYWIVAGPGSYFFLANRKRKDLSWFVFGAAAIAAAAMTPLLVRIVLHGGPELKHMSIAQAAAGEHTHVLSRIGLYIPHDGMQTISLSDTATDAQSMLSALLVHPRTIDSAEFPAAQDYNVPVHDPDQPVSIDVPFRTTLKKLQARWVGDTSAAIVGSAKLQDPSNHDTLKSYIAGTLTNQTGHDLEDVYLGFHHPSLWGGKVANWVLFVPKWKNGDPLDLDHEFKSAPLLATLLLNGSPRWDKDTARAVVDDDWAKHWYSYLNGVGNSDAGGATDARANTPILTFFDLLPPSANKADKSENCINLVRRGGRRLNLSGALLAGRLVIVGQSAGPIPCPLEVNDQKIGGDGSTIYQAVLPIDASAFDTSPTTSPATSPTTSPATGPATGEATGPDAQSSTDSRK
jgi:hypothetical protein